MKVCGMKVCGLIAPLRVVGVCVAACFLLLLGGFWDMPTVLLMW